MARGPRTPEERTFDAARSAATLLERTPATPFADQVLKPLGTLVRFLASPPEGGVLLRDVRELEEVERAFLAVDAEARRFLEFAPAAQGWRIELALDEIRHRLRAEKARVAAASTDSA